MNSGLSPFPHFCILLQNLMMALPAEELSMIHFEMEKPAVPAAGTACARSACDDNIKLCRRNEVNRSCNKGII